MTTLIPPSGPRPDLAFYDRSGPRGVITRERSQIRAHAHLAARFGRTGVAPFIAAPEVHVIDLVDGYGAAGFVRRRRWAVTPGDVVAPPALAESALAQFLAELHERRLRAAFMAVSDPEPYLDRGFAVNEVADEAVIDLPSFSLSGSKRANVRHAVTSARRAGLLVVPYAPWQDEQLAEVSCEWLSTKRGGELGFTLTRHDDVAAQLTDGTTDLWAVVDRTGRVQAWCTWRHYLGGQGRVIDVMRRRPHAPNPAMDFLLATTLEQYRDAGLTLASLASVPRDHGATAERVYPTRTLRSYKQKFAPRWEPRWLAVPHAWQRPLALLAICGAYCPGGIRRAAICNG
ncbi:MAG: phosphatidylglycerol lysyltransferase domain-containing protein [Jatrophihabitantaceae bacterium]